MGFFDNIRKNKCIAIINNLLEKGTIRNIDDRLYVLEHLDLWIDNYLKNGNVINFCFRMFYSEATNNKIEKSKVKSINNIFKSKFKISILDDDENYSLS